MTIIRFIGLIAGFAAFLYVIFVATKFMAAKTSKSMKGKNMSVVESLSLGIDKQLFLVRVGEKHVLLAGAGKSIEFVCEVDIDFQTDDVSQEASPFDFKSLFDKYIVNLSTRKKPKELKQENKITDEECFKSNLMKLRTINVKGGIHGGRDWDENANGQ